MIWIIIAFFAGGFLGILTMALLVASRSTWDDQ